MNLPKRLHSLLSILFISGLTLTVTASADNLPPGFDLAKWHALLETTGKNGKAVKTELGETRTVSRIVPNDLTVTHHADYLTTRGYTDSENKFHAGTTFSVSENWQLHADGNWYIDQWLYELSFYGDVISLNHMSIVERPDASVLDYNEIPNLGLTSPEELGRWGKQLDLWYAWTLTSQ